MDDRHLVEEKLSSEELAKGHFLHAYRDTVKLPNGAIASREYIVHPGAVMIVPCLRTQRVESGLYLSASFATLLDR